MISRSVLPIGLSFAILVTNLFGEASGQERGPLVCQSDAGVEMRLEGPMRLRIENNVQQWLLRGPRANPALLSVFELRDRVPNSADYYVPWVGEFIGKFLTNAIQFLRLSDDEELEKTVAILIERLIASQDGDGYLGPFPKKDRLLVRWDLWGHYHAVTALLLWHERTGDAKALDAACRAADFVCATFLDTGRRMKDVGSHEMNLSIITSFCQLYRLTGNERYWKMANEILKDWEDAGDYYRSGLSGKEYYQTPRPRWESIHCILALTELYRITGDENYRRAFMNLWRSARRLETHNNGSFSTNEQTIGNPYTRGAIETCCTVAWMAMTVDALRLTGDVACADALELATFNAATSMQHPSGSWSAYDTPMNGRRQASFHSIVFQSRPGQPELNCCSVNAPRAFGMISEWGLMKGRGESGRETLYVQYYGPGSTRLRVNDITVCLKQTTDYPRDGRILIEWESERETPLSIRFRIPQWAEGARIRRPGSDDWESAPCGDYFLIDRTWKMGDRIELDFPMTLRYETGDRDFADKISIYRGPLLLAYDQRFNQFEEDAIPAILPEQLQSAAVEIPPRAERDEYFGRYTPWILVTLGVGENNQTPLVLSDFGTAGELGTTYASWLPAQKIKPPIPACTRPAEGERVPPGALSLEWRRITRAGTCRFTAAISETPDFSRPILTAPAADERRVLLAPEQTAALEPGKTYYWKIAAENDFGRSESVPPFPGRSFVIDPNLPPRTTESFAKHLGTGPDRLLLADPLAGRPAPDCGTLNSAVGISPAEGPNGEKEGAVRFDGQTGTAVYALDEFPNEYTLSLDFAADRFTPEQDYAQIFSCWSRSGDDPLRVFIDAGGKLAAAVEGNGAGRTEGMKIESGRWYRLTVVKEEGEITLFLDGQKIGAFLSSEESLTGSRAAALGGNPLYRGKSEYFPGRIARFRFCAKAVRPE